MRENIRIRARKDIVGSLLLAAALFAGAGRLDWRIGWVYAGLYLLGVFVNLIVLSAKNPEVLASRADVTKEDTKQWDRVFTALYGPLALVIMAVIGLDAGRHAWSTVPNWLQWLSVAVFVFGWVFSLWAMLSNKFFETSVRIQQDRGHEVATTGPYAIVRHPGYLGIILVYISSSTLLGSWWGLVPALALVTMFFVRTSFEDRMLIEELPSYADYAKEVRYRLLPGIW